MFTSAFRTGRSGFLACSFHTKISNIDIFLRMMTIYIKGEHQIDRKRVLPISQNKIIKEQQIWQLNDTKFVWQLLSMNDHFCDFRTNWAGSGYIYSFLAELSRNIHQSITISPWLQWKQICWWVSDMLPCIYEVISTYLNYVMFLYRCVPWAPPQLHVRW